jgi:large subunit ribosomal protein L19
MSAIIDKINKEYMNNENMDSFSIGDTVSVHTRIHEGGKERIQVFKGTVIARDGKGATETFTVRRISHGVGVEKVFPVYSPNIAKMTVDAIAKTRRAKLYYLRDRVGKKARLKTTAVKKTASKKSKAAKKAEEAKKTAEAEKTETAEPVSAE